MNRDTRRRVISALKALNQNEFDSLMSEVHQARRAETAGAEVLAELFTAKAADSPLAALFSSQREGGPQ